MMHHDGGSRPQSCISVFLFIIKLIFFFFSFIGTQNVKLVIIALTIFIILPIDILCGKYFHKIFWPVTCIMLLLLICISFPLRNRIEPIRFSILANIYNAAAHQIMISVVTSEDTSWRYESVPWPLDLIVGNKVVVMKSDSHIALYFPTWSSTFNTFGMFYISDQAAQKWLFSPYKFDPGLSATDTYDWVLPLEESWYYVKLY